MLSDVIKPIHSLVILHQLYRQVYTVTLLHLHIAKQKNRLEYDNRIF